MSTINLANPYQPGKCWYGVRVPTSKQNGAGKAQYTPCGVGANLYDVVRGNAAIFKGSIVMTVWLCDTHRTAMEQQGFTTSRSAKKTVDIDVPTGA